MSVFGILSFNVFHSFLSTHVSHKFTHLKSLIYFQKLLCLFHIPATFQNSNFLSLLYSFLPFVPLSSTSQPPLKPISLQWLPLLFSSLIYPFSSVLLLSPISSCFNLLSISSHFSQIPSIFTVANLLSTSLPFFFLLSPIYEFSLRSFFPSVLSRFQYNIVFPS